MPKIKLVPFIEEIHGTLDGWVFKKSPQGKMIITKKPDMSKVKWSKPQKAKRQLFTTHYPQSTSHYSLPTAFWSLFPSSPIPSFINHHSAFFIPLNLHSSAVNLSATRLFFTARPIALRLPASTHSLLARVMAVYNRLRCSMV